MLNRSVKEFIDATSSSSPTPGGGSIAALVGCLSISLSSMMVSLTLGKKNYEEVQEEMLKYQDILNKYQEEVQEFIKLDIEAYNNVMTQYKLPKDNDEEKTFRSKKIQEATIKAAYVPLNLAKKMYELYDLIEVIMEKGNKNIYSDSLISLMLCHSAIEASLCNVVVNKNSIKDEKIKEDLDSKIKKLFTLSNNRKEKGVKKSHYFE